MWIKAHLSAELSLPSLFTVNKAQVSSSYQRLLILSPGPPGSGGARVTSRVIFGEVYGQSTFLVMMESVEEILNYSGELSWHLIPLLRILFYVKQHHRRRRVRLRGAGLWVVVTGPGEPEVTAWVASQQLPIWGSNGRVNGHIEAGVGQRVSADPPSQS